MADARSNGRSQGASRGSSQYDGQDAGRAEDPGDARAQGVPDPEDPGKPDSPREFSSTTWKGIGKRTVKEFLDDQCTDSAAALTYYGVLSMFPALLVLAALLSLVGDPEATVNALLNIAEQLGAQTDNIEEPIRNVVENGATGAALGFGLLGALWAASGYVAAFSRAMNRIWEVDEGRPFWKLRPLQILITVVALIGVAIIAGALVLTGPVAQAVGDVIGLGGTAVTVWQIVKWPVVVILASLLIALLYWSTPNVQVPKFRWFSPGAVFALVVWAVASLAFGFYVANFGNYDATYGALAGVIVFLLWLWITNNALLLGAELDAEMERGRELQAGLPAEEVIQLPEREPSGDDPRRPTTVEARRDHAEVTTSEESRRSS